MAANDLADPRLLRVGMRLDIPMDDADGGAVAATTDVFEYTVESGDSLWALARTYDTSVSALRGLNDLAEDDFLRIGQRIKIPRTTRDPSDGSTDSVVSEDESEATVFQWPHPGARSRITGRLVGVEITGDDGDEVRAVASGVVRFAQSFGIYGKVAIVQSLDGYFYLYGGQTELLVSIGDSVNAGDVLGLIGPIGSQRARAVFSVWFNSRFVAPEAAPRG